MTNSAKTHKRGAVGVSWTPSDLIGVPLKIPIDCIFFAEPFYEFIRRRLISLM